MKTIEEETITYFNGKLCDIVKESFALGENIPKEKLVKKALSSLPSKFAYKATTIREAKDLKRIRLEELIGSLLTFKIELNKEPEERNKPMGQRAKSKPPVDDGNELSKSVALLSKNFERAIKRLNAQAKGNPLTQKFPYGTFNSTKFGMAQGSPGPNFKNKSIESRECGGYGHI